MKKIYKTLPNNTSMLTKTKNPTLIVVKKVDDKIWLNHCYFKITSSSYFYNKSIMNVYYFAVYKNNIKLGTFTYTEIVNMLCGADDKLDLIAYPRATTKQKCNYKYNKHIMHMLVRQYRKFVKLNENGQATKRFKVPHDGNFVLWQYADAQYWNWDGFDFTIIDDEPYKYSCAFSYYYPDAQDDQKQISFWYFNKFKEYKILISELMRFAKENNL